VSRLHLKLEDLAQAFVHSVVFAVAASTIGELMEPYQTPHGARSNGSAGRLGVAKSKALPTDLAAPRRSRAEVESQKQAILVAASTLPTGFRKRDVSEHTGSRFNVSRALSLLVSEGKLLRDGERNAARYSLP
jgi:hypothetical protein